MNTQFKQTSNPSTVQRPRFKRALLAAVVISSCGLSVSSWAADAAAPVVAPASAPQADRHAPRPEWTAEQRAQFKAKREQERTARKAELFKQLDKNQDGQVTLAEWLAFQPEHHRGEGRFGEGRDGREGGRPHDGPPAGDFHPLASSPDGQTLPDNSPETRRAEHQAAWLQRVDTNHDGQISKAEAEANAPRLAEHFNEVDSNHDGLISAEELQAFHVAQDEKRHEKRQQHLTKVFEQADANHDGKLTLAEWQAYKPHHHGFWHRLWSRMFGHHDRDCGHQGPDGRGDDGHRDGPRDHGGPRGDGFKHLDSNGDGQLSLSEAQANAPRLAAHFNEIDTDHNGQISQDELRAFFSARRDQPRS